MIDKIPFNVYDFFSYLSSGFLLLAGVDYAFNGGHLAADNIQIPRAILWTIIVYIVGHGIAHLSSVVLEGRFVHRVLGSPELHLLEARNASRWSRIFRAHFKALPAETKKRVLERAREAGIEEVSRGLFFHCHAIVKCDQATLGRLNNFLSLYGFCRNISMTLLLASPIILVGAFFDSRGAVGAALFSQKSMVALATLAGSFVMTLRYLKFFRHYTLEVFLTYAELPKEKERPTT